MKGLGELFLGSPPAGMDKQKRIMTRKNSMQGVYEDLAMDNPASEKVPLLQEEGKVKRPFIISGESCSFSLLMLIFRMLL